MTWLRVLGPIEIAADPESEPGDNGNLTTLTSPRVRRLLAALTVRANEVASSDWLAEVVWSDRQPTNVDAALQTLVSRLRSALRTATNEGSSDIELQTTAPGYTLRLRPNQLDAATFEALATEGRRSLRESPDAAVNSCEIALRLWRGAPYAEFADEDFVRPESARLRELYDGVVLDRIEGLLGLGRHHEAASALEGIVRDQPHRERPHALLMLARYRAGMQTEALDVYLSYRARLGDELALEPSPSLRQLHTQILQQDSSLDWSDPTAGSEHGADSVAARAGADQGDESGLHATGNQGDVPDTRGQTITKSALVGRDVEVVELVQAVRPAALITLTGPGGVGKTSLARRVAAEVSPAFADGAWWCELAAVSEPDAVANAVRTTLGAPPRQGASNVDRLVDYLRHKQALLVLDNCEHLVDAIAQIVDAVRVGCPRVAILATSRMPLEVATEHVWPVSPLALPEVGQHDRALISGEPSVELFVERATAQVRGFVLDDTNADHVAEICRRLDGLPLAIELAASRMRSMSPADLAGRLSWRFRLLHGGVRSADGRHRTLRAVVDWSYELLDADHQRVLEMLSVFAGAFTLDDPEALARRISQLQGSMSAADPAGDAGLVSSVVLDLVDQSMVTADPDAPLPYSQLETIRAYSRERLQERPYADSAYRAHAELFADLAVDSVPHLFGPRHLERVDAITAHFDEMRAAFTWSIEHDLTLATRLVGGMTPYVEHRMSAEVAHWALRVIETASTAGRTPRGLARVYAVAASGARFASALDLAKQLVDQGHQLADDPLSTTYLLYVSSELALFEGRYDDAWELLEVINELTLAHDLGGFGRLSDVLRALLLAYGGDPELAEEIADKLRADADEQGNALLATWAAYTQGEVRLDREPDLALEFLDHALDASRRSGDRYLTGVTLVSAASGRSRHGNPAEALALFRDVIVHWYDSGNWLHQWTTMRNVVDLLVRLEHDEDAGILVGAMRARDSSVEPFGDEASRFEAAALVLASRLDSDALERLLAEGAAMSDDEVVAFVLNALDVPATP